MKIIVLSKTEYNEKDLIITALNEKEQFSFKVRGALSPTNPFKWLNNPLTVAEVEFAGPQTYKYPILKRAVLISSPMTKEQDLNQLTVVGAVAEATMKMLSDDERHLVYNDILGFLEYYSTKSGDMLTSLLIYLGKLVKYAGFEINVKECVYCGSKKDIVAFSFADGGFVCRHCFNEGIDKDLTPAQMVLARFVFSAPDFSYFCPEGITEDDKKTLLSKINIFINDAIGVKISAIDMILK